MCDYRIPRSVGSILRLGGTDFKLEAVEGCGGSTIVYRAQYENHLNTNCLHHVLIKELFPFHPNQLIFRSETGDICCLEAGISLMELYRQRFYAGNQANLMLLHHRPEQMSGNMDSYAAYGTYYSVIPIHGGEILAHRLERQPLTLKESAQILLWILEALDCFHHNGLLHLDISPDNILLLSRRVLLIDYNSAWPMELSWKLLIGR